MAAVAEYDMDAIYRICGPEPRRHAPPVLPGQRGVDMKQREELKRQIKQTHDAWEACVAREKRNVDVLREREYTAIMALRKKQRATEEAERQLQMEAERLRQLREKEEERLQREAEKQRKLAEKERKEAEKIVKLAEKERKDREKAVKLAEKEKRMRKEAEELAKIGMTVEEAKAHRAERLVLRKQQREDKKQHIFMKEMQRILKMAKSVGERDKWIRNLLLREEQTKTRHEKPTITFFEKGKVSVEGPLLAAQVPRWLPELIAMYEEMVNREVPHLRLLQRAMVDATESVEQSLAELQKIVPQEKTVGTVSMEQIDASFMPVIEEFLIGENKRLSKKEQLDPVAILQTMKDKCPTLVQSLVTMEMSPEDVLNMKEYLVMEIITLLVPTNRFMNAYTLYQDRLAVIARLKDQYERIAALMARPQMTEAETVAIEEEDENENEEEDPDDTGKKRKSQRRKHRWYKRKTVQKNKDI
jgi:hypothetical protein